MASQSMDSGPNNALRREKYFARPPEQHQQDLQRRRMIRAQKKRLRLSGEDEIPSVSVPQHTFEVERPSELPAVVATPDNTIITSSHSKRMVSQVTSSSSGASGVQRAHVSVGVPVTSGQARKRRRSRIPLDDLPVDPWLLPSVEHCVYCGAYRFYREVPGFCCGEGQTYLAPRELLSELANLLLGSSEVSVDFRRLIRSYNNHLAYSSIGMKFDKKYCWSNKGVYTLTVQGMVYHHINSINESVSAGCNLDLYFHEVDESIQTNGGRVAQLNPDLLVSLIRILDGNPYSRFFRSLRSYNHLSQYVILLHATPDLDQRTFNLPTVSQIGAIWNETCPSDATITRDIRVYVNEESSHRIQYYYGCYDPLQYPLLFPRGEPGWHARIRRSRKHSYHPLDGAAHAAVNEAASLISPSLAESANVLLQNEAAVLEEHSQSGSDISMRQYYCYLFQIRARDKSCILHFGRLGQQYFIDMYIKLETQRLDYYRSEQRQQDLRTDTYEGVFDSISVDGQNNACAVGRRFVLPSSFIGGPRDMRRRYVNAMSLVQKYGRPDLFITMTCNPAWPEITDLLLEHERADDRPDLIARVFKSKMDELKNDIVRCGIFGPVAAYVYVVEFQKRGLPHVHWLVILRPSHKLTSPDMYDGIVSAELPSTSDHPFLRSYVTKHMMHGPCGSLNPTNVCMRDGQCKNHYPKDFADFTRIGANSYPVYKRRYNGDSVIVRKTKLDNRWIVPYNPYLLAKYNCHINVEVCCGVKLVKYLYKYIYKGHDRIAYHVVTNTTNQDHDEIRQFQTGRWVAAPEALWRIYGFGLSDMHPPVIVLQVHLENQQIVRFGRQQPLSDVVSDNLQQRTMLTEFFKLNACDEKARTLNLLYSELPQHYVWNQYSRTWRIRSKKEVVGRLVTVNPCEGERFYERLLLNNIRAPPSMQFLRTVNGKEYSTFREAALQLGLLESDSYIYECLEEACLHQMAYSLRRLFATILVFCNPTDPVRLWTTFATHLSHDLVSQLRFSETIAQRRALESIHFILQSMGKSINDYSLTVDGVRLTEEEKFTHEYEREKAIVVSEQDLLAEGMLNDCQKMAFDSIISAFHSSDGGSFFVDGPGGAGKTFLYRAVLAYVRSRGHIALSVATSGVAASLLPGGRTAHSRFKFPIDIEEGAKSTLSKQSGAARLIKASKVIVWDEATMANKSIVEALDTLLREICDSQLKFGGKVVLFGGDFRQTLPIIVGGSRDDMVQSSLVSSLLWPSVTKFKLSINMRAREDPLFTDFLLNVGDGALPFLVGDYIQLPSHLCIPFTDPEESLGLLIASVFPSFELHPSDPYSVVSRAILTPKNDDVDDINAQLIQSFPGSPIEYMSFDKTDDPTQQSDYGDYISTISVAGLPPHKLVLKVNCPVMLLRNLDPSEGLCNGTRLIVKHLGPRLISAEIAIGDYKGRHVFIPRIPLQASDRLKCPIPFKRHQFPLRLCFAMTINKAQGQTLDYVGVYLHEPVFSHGQLYVALSRARTSHNVKVLVRPISAPDMQSDLIFIDDVTPGTPTWRVKVHVEEKMPVRQSSSSPTRYQKLILSDEKGSKVVATLYQGDINALGNTLLVGNTYIISKARVDHVEEKFRIVDNPYQWIINSKTAMLRVTDECIAVANTTTPLVELSSLPTLVGSKSLIDLLVVVIDKFPQRSVVSNGRSILVQDLGVIDTGMKPYVLTLWSSLAADFGSKLKVDGRNMPVIKFTRFIVNTYYGISLGSTSTSSAAVNPQIPEAVQLTAWKRKNVETLRQIAAARDYMSNSAPVRGGAQLQTMDIGGLMDSTEYGKMKVLAQVKITNFKQRCYYASCDKCPSATSAEIGWEFECSRCQELRVSIPRAMVAVLMYDKDAEVDALVFGAIAERLLRKPAIDCMHYALEGQEGFLHNVNDHLEGENYVFVVRKKRIVRKKQEEDQYVITEIVDVDDAPVIATEDPLVQTVDRGKRNTLLSDSLSLGDCGAKLDSISTNDSVVELIGNDGPSDQKNLPNQLKTSIEDDGAHSHVSIDAHTKKGRRKLFLRDESDDDDLSVTGAPKRAKE